MENNRVEQREPYMIPAISQAMDLLFCLSEAESDRMSLAEICDRLGVHKSRAFSILQTLQRFDVIQTDGKRKGYGLGPGLIRLSRKFLDNLGTAKLAQPLLEDLVRKAKSTAAFGLIAGKHVYVVAKQEGDHPLSITMRVGHRFPATWGCHGKAIAAFLPEKELENLLQSKNLYFHGEPGRFDRLKLEQEVRECRERWFADDQGEMVPGHYAVAAPVLGPHGAPIGYIAVLGLFSTEATERCGLLAAEAGKALSRRLGTRVD